MLIINEYEAIPNDTCATCYFRKFLYQRKDAIKMNIQMPTLFQNQFDKSVFLNTAVRDVKSNDWAMDSNHWGRNDVEVCDNSSHGFASHGSKLALCLQSFVSSFLNATKPVGHLNAIHWVAKYFCLLKICSKLFGENWKNGFKFEATESVGVRYDCYLMLHYFALQ